MSVKIKRLLAGLIDFYIICLLSSAFVGVLTLGKFNVSLLSVTIYLILTFLFLMFKDFALKNASVGKRLFGLKVVKKDGTKFIFLDVIKRNITIMILLPIEVIFLVVNENRIGDIFAKTLVVGKTKDRKTGDGSL